MMKLKNYFIKALLLNSMGSRLLLNFYVSRIHYYLHFHRCAMVTCTYWNGEENDDWHDLSNNFSTKKYASLPKPDIIEDLYEDKHYA